MFADSFYDSGWSNHSHRGWTTLVSFAVQSLALFGLLLLPLLYTQGLPRLTLLMPVLAPTPPAPAPPLGPHSNPRAPLSNMMERTLLSPSRIPQNVDMLEETAPPPPAVDASGFGVSRGTGVSRGNVLDSIAGPGLVFRHLLRPWFIARRSHT